MRTQMKLVSVLIAAFAIATGAALPALGDSDSAHLASLHDRARSEHGLASLAVASDLARDAQSHAQDMAARGEISHSGRTSNLDGWNALGENVGWAGSVDEVFDLFMDSQSHRDNILDPTWDSIGLGVASSESGEVYVSVLFGDRADAPAPSEPAPAKKPAAKKPRAKSAEHKKVPAPPVPAPSLRATPVPTPSPVPVAPRAPVTAAPAAPVVEAPAPKDASRVLGLLLSVEREHQAPRPDEAAAIGDVSAGLARQRFSESDAERRREAEASEQGAAARSLGGVARCAWSCRTRS